MKAICSMITVILCLSFSVSAGMFVTSATVYACPHEDDDCNDHHHETHKEFHGTVEVMPENLTGTWIIGGTEVTVTENTRIYQKHRKILVGSYVEVEGSSPGTAFVAHKIKIEKNRQ